MIGWLATTAGTAVVSAIVPVVNLEVYLVVATRAANPDVPWLVLGLIAAAGQILGKLLFFYAGRGSVQLTRRLRHKMTPKRSQRWSRWFHRFRQASSRSPLTANGILLVSAILGAPPFAIMATLAGTVDISAARFVAVGFIGRAVRFCAIAAAPGLLL